MTTVGTVLSFSNSIQCSPHAVSHLCKLEEEVSPVAPVVNLKIRKTFKGHRGRILHFDWSPDKSHVITAGQVRCHRAVVRQPLCF
jgi:WD40 repeat protein